MKNLIILDKDATLVEPASGNKFVQHPQDQQLLPNVAELLKRYYEDGWDIGMATNQGGVEAGHKTLEEAQQEVEYCMELLPYFSIAVFCPTFEGETAWFKASSKMQMRWFEIHKFWVKEPSGFRKPDAGMLRLIAGTDKYDRILYVGDRPEDEAAAKAMGCEFMWAGEWRRTL